MALAFDVGRSNIGHLQPSSLCWFITSDMENRDACASMSAELAGGSRHASGVVEIMCTSLADDKGYLLISCYFLLVA